MQQNVKDHLIRYNEKKQYGISDKDLVESVTEGREIWSEEGSNHRWWRDEYRVVEIDGMYIGFNWATTTGDDTAEEKGWEFDPDTIEEVEKVEEVITVTKYVPVKQK